MIGWIQKYRVFSRPLSDPFCGFGREYVLVSRKSGRALAHFRQWDNGSVIERWHPLRAPLVGKIWKRSRPRGFRLCRDQSQELDWAVEAWGDWSD